LRALKTDLERLLHATVARLADAGTLPAADTVTIVVERARDAGHGDFTSNVALRLAKAARRTPRELAADIVAALPASPLVQRVEVAGAGFINFHVDPAAQAAEIFRVLELGTAYGRSHAAAGRRVLLEFVSANPTGPLHVGHGRHAAYGASLASLLEATGHLVHREYYVNDAGRQIDILALSVYLRYLERCGETPAFPSNGYRGDYVHEVAAHAYASLGPSLSRPVAELYASAPPDAPAGDKERHVDALIQHARERLGIDAWRRIVDLSVAAMLEAIRVDLAEFGVTFDRWFSERTLAEGGAIDRALAKLAALGRLYERDGATWFRASEFGDDQDRVVVRANGEKTYFASDIAYHFEKRERGFDLLIDVLGADHHGYVARVRGGLVAMGEPADCFEVSLMQLVNLYRGGEKVPMGKREGTFVTMRQLREEVGNDAARFYYVMRGHEQALDFDLELAKSRTNENPVYYIQYAHARVASVMKQLASRGLAFEAGLARANAAQLSGEHEQAVLAALSRYPEVVAAAAANRAPHALVHYLRDLANAFHAWYNAATFIVDEPDVRNARLALALAVRQVIANGLGLLGVSAPDTM
jgi:arginyl-tRNA synthetase